MQENQAPKQNILELGKSKKSKEAPQYRSLQQSQICPQLQLIKLKTKNEQIDAKIKILELKLESLINQNMTLDKQIAQKQQQRIQALHKFLDHVQQSKSQQLSQEMEPPYSYFNPSLLIVNKYSEQKLNNLKCKLCGQKFKEGQNYSITPCCILTAHQNCLKNSWEFLLFCPGCENQ